MPPIYEYNCTKCTASFETTRKMSDPPLTECLVCGTVNTVIRIFSQTAPPVFKGRGWFDSDYKKKPRK